MIGGWMSFAGIEGKARYHDTLLEESLPATCLPYDDRQERPAGARPRIAAARHPILRGVPARWPALLGYNRVQPRPQSTLVLDMDKGPLLCVWDFGNGRSAAFTSDCAPHWGPPQFLKWKGYPIFWNNLVNWLTKRS